MTATLLQRTSTVKPLSSEAFRLSALGWATIVGFLLLWQAASFLGFLDAEVIPSAREVFTTLFQLLFTGAFWDDLGATVYSALSGLGLVLIIGSVAALCIATLRPVEKSTWFLIEFLKPIPPIALIPLGLLLWGPSPTMKITLITFGALWPFLTQMVYGIRQTNNVALDMAATYRLGRRLTTQYIVLPTLL